MERMKRLLFEASLQGSATSLLLLLHEDPLILDRLTLNCYDDMPLHVASMFGHIDFVKEILTRKPQLAMERDSQRCLPLHIASAKGHVEIVKALVSVNPETCLAPDGDGRNPLHLAAIKGQDRIVKELVQAQPHAARAMVQHETILHLCVKHNQLEVLKFLVEMILGDHDFVNAKDVDGNTILHLAVADKQIETINFLLLHTTINVNASNTNGDTPVDVLAQGRRDVKDLQIMKSLERTRQVPNDAQSTIKLGSLDSREKPPSPSSLQIGFKKHSDWLEKKRNTLMVVASLIATMAFQAGTNPPGGVWQGDSTVDPPLMAGSVDPPTASVDPHRKAGEAVMAHEYQEFYNLFLVCNTVGFVSALSIILLLISGLPFLKRRIFMWILMVTMWIAIMAMSLTYLVSIWVLTPDPVSKTFQYVAIGIVLVWILLMILVLLGHTIRLAIFLVRHTIQLIAIAIRTFRKLSFPRKRSNSSPIVGSHA